MTTDQGTLDRRKGLDQPLKMHPLTFLEEGDEVTIGRADIDSYGLFPSDGAALVRRLEAGDAPREAARWYQETYGEQVDIEEFLDVLDEFDLMVKDGEEAATIQQVGWQRLGRALFSPVAWCCYALLVAAALVQMVRDPAVAPSYQHLFFTHSSLTILALGIVLGQVPWMLLHEAFHALAGRRLGLNSKVSIGRRFYYVVFVTSLDGLMAVPRRKRYLPMLAGMLLDVLATAGLTLAASALGSATGFGALVYKLCLCMAFGVLLRIAWQFYFFIRTDLYYLIMTVLGCNDLQTVSRQMFWNRVNRRLGRQSHMVDESTWTPRDADVARWYQWLIIAGYGFLTVLLVTVMAPTAIRLTKIALHQLGTDRSVLSIADVTVFLFLNFSDFIIAGFLALRSYHRRDRSAEQPPVPAAGSTSESASDLAPEPVLDAAVKPVPVPAFSEIKGEIDEQAFV